MNSELRFIKNFISDDKVTWTKFHSEQMNESTPDSEDWSQLILNRDNFSIDTQDRIFNFEDKAIDVLDKVISSLDSSNRHLKLNRKEEFTLRFYGLVLAYSNIAYTHWLASSISSHEEVIKLQEVLINFILDEYNFINKNKIDGVHEWLKQFEARFKGDNRFTPEQWEEVKEDLIINAWSLLNVVRYDKVKLFYTASTFCDETTKTDSVFRLWPISSKLVICFYLPSDEALKQGHEKLRPFNCSLVKNHRFTKYKNQSIIDNTKDQIVKEFPPHMRDQAWAMWWSDNRIKYLDDNDVTTYDVIDSTESSQDTVNAFMLENANNEVVIISSEKDYADAYCEYKMIFSK